MPANTIAKASLQIDANPSQLQSQLNQMQGGIGSWGKKVESQVSNAGKSLETKGKPPAAGGGWGKALLGGAAIGTAVLAVKKLGDVVSETFTKIKEMTTASRELGVGLEGFTSIGHAAKVAGVEAGDLKGGLSSMLTVLRGSDEEAGRVFGQIGLQVEELRNLPIDAATSKIASALAGVDDPSEKARIALQVFGDKAVQLQPLLDKGGEGIQALSDEAKKLGVALNDADAAKMKGAQEALERVGGAWEGFKQQILVGLAPAFEGILTWTLKIKDSIVDTFKTDYFKAFVVGLGLIWDSLKYGAGLWLEYIQVPANKAFAAVVDAGASVINFISDMGDKVGLSIPKVDASSFTDALRESNSLILKDAEKLKSSFGESANAVLKYFDTLEQTSAKRSSGLAQAVAKPLDAIKAKVLQGINDLEKELRKGMQTIGLTGGEQKIFELRQSGASDKELKKVQGLAEQIKNVEIGFSNVKMPPLETFERSVAGLDTLLENGRINLVQYQQGIVEAAKGLQDAVGLAEPKAVQAQFKDSSAAVSTIIKAQMQEQRQDPQAELRRAMIEAKEIQRKQLEVAMQQLNFWQGQREPTPEVI